MKCNKIDKPEHYILHITGHISTSVLYDHPFLWHLSVVPWESLHIPYFFLGQVENHDFGHEWGRRESYGGKNTRVLHIIASRIQWDWSQTSTPVFLIGK